MSAPAPLTPRTGLPMPVDLSGLDLGILPCARVTAYDSAGEEVTQIRASSCAYQYVKSLQKALMGYVWCAVECGPPPWYAASKPPRYVAIKELRRTCVDSHTTLEGRPVAEDPWQELRVMRYLPSHGHPNICHLLNILQDETYLYIVLEFIPGGDIFGRLEAGGKLPEAAARQAFSQLLDGADYIHTAGLAHLDLSLENVMLKEDTGKIIDFGTAKSVPDLTGGPLGPGFVGKRQYAAPEIMAGRMYSGTAADVWSMGVMLFMLLFGVPPFAEASPRCQIFGAVKTHGLLVLLNHWGLTETVSLEALQVVVAMLTVDPAARPSMAAVRASKWLAAPPGK